MRALPRACGRLRRSTETEGRAIRVIGIDPSLTSTALAEVVDGKLTRVTNIKTTGKKGDDVHQVHARLSQIAAEAMEFICPNGRAPDLIVIEGPAFASRFGSPHDRSGLWWILVSRILSYCGPINFIVVAPATRAKYGTGDGRANKDVVLAHVIERYTTPTVRITNDDIADAVILAAMGARKINEPVEAELSSMSLAAMTTIVIQKHQ